MIATMSILTGAFLFLMLSSLALSSDESHYCSRNEAAILLKIRRDIGNPPSLLSWNISADCCTWTGVGCDYSLRRVNDFLIFQDPNFTGPIPSSLSQLTHLSSIRIHANPNLSGKIPTSLCKLQNLVSLHLWDNKLTGPIPGCLGNTVIDIVLSRNRLSGPIPDTLMHGVTSDLFLPRLMLDGNQLSGPIPKSLGDVPINYVDLSQNRLTGDASFMFGEKKSVLEWINLSGNRLKFDMSNVTFPLRLQNLDLNHNKIYGSIPRQLSKLGMILSFNVSYNNLCGPIPTAGFMKKFGLSSFEHNRCLCGGPLQPCH